jgi:hypothetical protein
MSVCIGASPQASGPDRHKLLRIGLHERSVAMLLLPAACHRDAVVNRRRHGPININNDHSDSMGGRESGSGCSFTAKCPGAYDNLLMAHRIAEHRRLLPLCFARTVLLRAMPWKIVVLEMTLSFGIHRHLSAKSIF